MQIGEKKNAFTETKKPSFPESTLSTLEREERCSLEIVDLSRR